MARLLIGSYILDSADSSSSSTTTGATFELDGDDPLSPQINNDSFDWPVMFVHVTAASESALKTAVDTVVDTINECTGKAVVYEETSGTTLFEMHPNIWPEAEAETRVDWGQTEADIAFSIRGLRPGGALTGGSADEPGQKSINWQYETTAGGIAGMICTAEFGPTLSGTTVTAGARENAIAFINKMDNTANYPAWLDTNFRRVGAVVEFDQKGNQSSIAESSYDPCVAVVQFRELDSTLAADAAWPSQALGATWSVNMEPRDPLNVRSSQRDAGFNLELVGTIQLKTEGSTTFNSSETSLTDAQTYQAALDAVGAIVTQFRAIYTTFLLTQMGSPRIDVDAISGLCGFSVTFTSTAGILQWEEGGEVRNSWPKAYSRASDGTDWRYANEGGPVKILAHSLRIVSLNTPQPYRPPAFIARDWDEVEIGVTPTVEAADAGGVTTIYTTRGDSVWRYLNKTGRTVDPDRRTQLQSHPTWDTINSGDLG
jgi:hypothetical protein